MALDPFEDQRRTLNDPTHRPTTILGNLARERQEMNRDPGPDYSRRPDGPRPRSKPMSGFSLFVGVCLIAGLLYMAGYWWFSAIIVVLYIVGLRGRR